MSGSSGQVVSAFAMKGISYAFEDVECSARVPYKYLYPPHEHPVSAFSPDLLLYLVRLSDSDQLELYVK